MKRTLVAAVLFMGMMLTPVWAQSVPSHLQNRDDVVYKWTEGGKVHYGKRPPRGIEAYIVLNKQGMELSQERIGEHNIIRPLRSFESSDPNVEISSDSSNNGKMSAEEKAWRKKNCDQARHYLAILQGKQTVYEDDGNGNAVPLSPEMIAQRLEQTQSEIETYCSQQSN